MFFSEGVCWGVSRGFVCVCVGVECWERRGQWRLFLSFFGVEYLSVTGLSGWRAPG